MVSEGRGHGAERAEVRRAAVCRVSGSQGHRAERTAETRVMQRVQTGGATAVVGQLRQRRPSSWRCYARRTGRALFGASGAALLKPMVLGRAERPSNTCR